MYRKEFITSKDVLGCYGADNIYVAPYCDPVVNDLRHKGVWAKYYNSGTYGWNYDVYECYDKKRGRDVAIVSGYRVPKSLSKQFISGSPWFKGDPKNLYHGSGSKKQN